MKKVIALLKITHDIGGSMTRSVILHIIFKHYYYKLKKHKLIDVVEKIERPLFHRSTNILKLNENLKILKAIDYIHGNVMCKETSLVAYKIFLIYNYIPEYHLGVVRDGKNISGHAWVTSLEGIYFDTCDNAENYQTIWKWSQQH